MNLANALAHRDGRTRARSDFAHTRPIPLERARRLRVYEKNLEQPAYTVVEKDGAFELRDYSPVLVAETAVAGERSFALKAGIQRLAGYIFGNKREKIAMTAPVFSDGAKGVWRTRFVMPARFTAATLPAMPEGVTAAELPRAAWRWSASPASAAAHGSPNRRRACAGG